jgi:tRNA1(Val) A37 N6-methylase TrmN6
MDKCKFNPSGTVLELMAGCGRNSSLLHTFFNNVEMLERNETMVRAIEQMHADKPIIVHHESVQQFAWQQHIQEYECVICVWGLGYLSSYEGT